MEDTKTRIRIAVGNAVIEIEGTEDYIEKKLKEPDSFDLLIKKLSSEAPSTPTAGVEVKSAKKVKAKKKKLVSKGTETYSIVPNLDLSATDNIPSVKDFYNEKKPTTAMECNVVFVYYLKKMKSIEKVGSSHIYTCYKDVRAKVPGRLYQSLIDTRNRYGWIITTNMEDINIGTVGENYVENELPKKKQSK